MQTRLGQVQDHLSSQTVVQNGNKAAIKEIPYDYVATFVLNGHKGDREQDVINISTEGTFVAVSVGYSFIPKVSLINSDLFKKNEEDPGDGANNNISKLLDPSIDQFALLQSVFSCLLVKVCGIEFKYSIIDSGTGRELQNKPIHNIAGLGESNGIRPFRPMAKPMWFQPRSTIRIEVEEVSDSPLYVGAELNLILHGYKMLGVGT